MMVQRTSGNGPKRDIPQISMEVSKAATLAVTFLQPYIANEPNHVIRQTSANVRLIRKQPFKYGYVDINIGTT